MKKPYNPKKELLYFDSEGLFEEIPVELINYEVIIEGDNAQNLTIDDLTSDQLKQYICALRKQHYKYKNKIEKCAEKILGIQDE